MGRGRKPVLTRDEKLVVGGECHHLWQALAEQTAMTAYRTRTELRDVKEIQCKLAAVPVASRSTRVWQDTLRQDSCDIAEIFSDIETQPIQKKRPYAKRAEILDAAVEWCAAKYGKTITKRRAQDCWDAFSAITKRLEREPG